MPTSSNRRRYDPNQPRVSKGHSNAGEWTRSGDQDELASSPERDPSARASSRYDDFRNHETHHNRDGTEIRVQYAEFKADDWDERRSIKLPTGATFTFEYDGKTQRVYDERDNLLSTTPRTDIAMKSLSGWCRIVKNLCIAECTGVLPTRDFGTTFHRCMIACMHRHGCDYLQAVK